MFMLPSSLRCTAFLCLSVLVVLSLSTRFTAASSFDLPNGVLSGAVPDWLVTSIRTPTKLRSGSNSQPCIELLQPSSNSSGEEGSSSLPRSTDLSECGCVVLTNGLISRTFLLGPLCGWATVDLYSHSAQQSLLRAVSPEALLTIDSVLYPLGGLMQNGSSEFAYADRTQWGLVADTQAWTYKTHRTSLPEAVYEWTPGTRHSPAGHWSGRRLASISPSSCSRLILRRRHIAR